MLSIMIKMLRLLNSEFVVRNSIFSKRSGQAGFTLMDVIMIIVIVSVFMAAIGIPLLNSLR